MITQLLNSHTASSSQTQNTSTITEVLLDHVVLDSSRHVDIYVCLTTASSAQLLPHARHKVLSMSETHFIDEETKTQRG
jgi:hypothetical protein